MQKVEKLHVFFITKLGLLQWSLGIHRSLNFLSPILETGGLSSTVVDETALLLLAKKVLSGSGSKAAKGESSTVCIHELINLHEGDHDSTTHKHRQELYQGLVNQIP